MDTFLGHIRAKAVWHTFCYRRDTMDANIYQKRVTTLAVGIVESYAVSYPKLQEVEQAVNRIVVQESLSFVLRNIKAIQQVNAESDDIDFWKDVFWSITQHYPL